MQLSAETSSGYLLSPPPSTTGKIPSLTTDGGKIVCVISSTGGSVCVIEFTSLKCRRAVCMYLSKHGCAIPLECRTTFHSHFIHPQYAACDTA